MTGSPSRRLLMPALAAALALGGCGGSGGGGSSSTSAGNNGAQAWPKAGAGTLEQLKHSMPTGPSLALSGEAYQAGSNRFGFILLDRAQKQITGAKAAVYTASGSGKGVKGPFWAKTVSLTVKKPFQSKTVAGDPNAAKSLYVAQLPLTAPNSRVLVVARLDGRLVGSTELQIPVGTGAGPPKVGQPAIRVHTPTAASVHGDLSKIDTRIPPDDMHKVDLFNALGREPVILAFATPALCQSRTCGPIIDELLQAEQRFKGKAAFIHMEIYNGNDPRKGHRPQVLKWHLPSEPWIFAINRKGIVAARLEGAAGESEIEQAIEKAIR